MASSLSAGIIARAESYPGIKAGLARLEAVLDAPSYRAVPDGEFTSGMVDEVAAAEWPPAAESVLVLGLHHSEDKPRLDWWAGGVSPGDRRLVEICGSLGDWLRDGLGISCFALPYSVEPAGVFLKDAAALAGLGVFGRSNLLVTPDWGPRIRFRAMLLDEKLAPTGPLEGFSPCESCAELCHLACPRDVFHTGVYHRPTCIEQMDADVAHKLPNGEVGEDGKPGLVVKYCRACELACPAGA